MAQKRSPWIKIVLVVAVLAFIGVSIFPLLSSVLNERQSQTRTAPATASTLSAEKQAELESQARGYELVVQREPENESALRGLLETRLQLGDVEGAIEPLEKLAELNPEQTDYGVLLAQAKAQIGDREGAAQAYRDILSSNPGNMNALQGLASLLIQQNRPEAAIGLLEDTLKTANQVNEIQPGTVDVTSVQLLLGQVYTALERYTEAIAIYDETITRDEQDFRPVLAKALVLRRQGRPAQAKPLFDRAIALAPARYKDQVKQQAQETTATASPDEETSEVPEPLPAEE